MSESRSSILARLAASLQTSPFGRGISSSVTDQLPVVTRQPDSLLEQFTARLADCSATWEQAGSPIAARLRLVGRLQDEGITRVMSWTGDQLPLEGLLDTLDALGIEAIIPYRRQEPLSDLTVLESVEVGITGGDGAIATTGSLILVHGPGRSRLVSQLPRRHIVLLPSSRLYPTLEAWWVAGQAWPQAAAPAQVTLISGPSQSLDIELLPTVGVHGPRQLHVIIVNGI